MKYFIFFLSYESVKIQIYFTLLVQLNLNAFYVFRSLMRHKDLGCLNLPFELLWIMFKFPV